MLLLALIWTFGTVKNCFPAPLFRVPTSLSAAATLITMSGGNAGSKRPRKPEGDTTLVKMMKHNQLQAEAAEAAAKLVVAEAEALRAKEAAESAATEQAAQAVTVAGQDSSTANPPAAGSSLEQAGGRVKVRMGPILPPAQKVEDVVCSNGPEQKPENQAAIKDILREAVGLFVSARKRCPQRSSRAQRRKRKAQQGDVLAELSGLYDAVYNDGTDDGFSVEEINRDDGEGGVQFGGVEHVTQADSNGDEAGEDSNDVDETARLAAYRAVAPYIPDQGYAVLPLPEQLKVLKKGELIAHRFIDGWETGKVVKRETSAARRGQYSVKYTSLGPRGVMYYHDLTTQNYGVELDWVMLGKVGPS